MSPGRGGAGEMPLMSAGRGSAGEKPLMSAGTGGAGEKPPILRPLNRLADQSIGTRCTYCGTVHGSAFWRP